LLRAQNGGAVLGMGLVLFTSGLSLPISLGILLADVDLPSFLQFGGSMWLFVSAVSYRKGCPSPRVLRDRFATLAPGRSRSQYSEAASAFYARSQVRASGGRGAPAVQMRPQPAKCRGVECPAGSFEKSRMPEGAAAARFCEGARNEAGPSRGSPGRGKAGNLGWWLSGSSEWGPPAPRLPPRVLVSRRTSARVGGANSSMFPCGWRTHPQAMLSTLGRRVDHARCIGASGSLSHTFLTTSALQCSAVRETMAALRLVHAPARSMSQCVGRLLVGGPSPCGPQAEHQGHGHRQHGSIEPSVECAIARRCASRLASEMRRVCVLSCCAARPPSLQFPDLFIPDACSIITKTISN